MSRKHTKRRHIIPSAPMLVNRGLVESEVEVRERMFVQAFSLGYATTTHYDEITDMRNVLAIAAEYKNDMSAKTMCDAMRDVMANIRGRYARTGKMGASGEELMLLRHFCTEYRDFWMRQPVRLYEQACDELHRIQGTGVLNRQAEVAA
jgi:hypothetical protein